jgi:adenosine deaminase
MGAIDHLGAERIDHGVTAEQDDAVVDRLVRDGIPLTMCPLSNLALRVVEELEAHNLKRLLDRGVRVTVNSDDPAYFGGYILDNYLAIQRALDLDREDLTTLARNAIEASFLPSAGKFRLLAELDSYTGQGLSGA